MMKYKKQSIDLIVFIYYKPEIRTTTKIIIIMIINDKNTKKFRKKIPSS